MVGPLDLVDELALQLRRDSGQDRDGELALGDNGLIDHLADALLDVSDPVDVEPALRALGGKSRLLFLALAATAGIYALDRHSHGFGEEAPALLGRVDRRRRVVKQLLLLHLSAL